MGAPLAGAHLQTVQAPPSWRVVMARARAAAGGRSGP